MAESVAYVVLASVALLASGLTLFSGFGLGTLLLPPFLLFFPAEVAVPGVALVHFANNVFKLGLLGRSADRGVVLRLGLPAVPAALLGADLLFRLSELAPLGSWALGAQSFEIAPVKLAMAAVIATFAALELHPALERLAVPLSWLPLGGVLAGFFGGLSGHQGALRSAFLLRAGLDRDAFIATGVVIACIVDLTRLSVYASHLEAAGLRERAPLLAVATASAFLGAWLGARWLRKVTLRAVQLAVSVGLFAIAGGLAAGLL
jgi:hypothetical protein